MFIAKQEIILGTGEVIAEGAEVKQPTLRMKELGLVVEVKEKRTKKKEKVLVEDSSEITVETIQE